MQFLKNRFVIGCLCLIAACAVGFIGVPALTNAAAQKVTVVISQRDIIKGSEITEDMFREHQISRGDIPYANGVYYSVIRPNNIATNKPLFVQKGEKLYAACDIYANDIVTTNKVTTEYPYTDMELRTLDNNHYAVSASVSSLSAGVAGKVREGDVLTLMIYSDNDAVFVDSYLNYVKVISVSNSEASDIKDNSDSGSKIPSVITFEVNMDQAMLLAEYNANYSIHYALAARGDTEKAQAMLDLQGKQFKYEHKIYGLEDMV